MLRLVARFGLGCEFGRRWWLVCWVLILVACVWVTFCGFAWCSSLCAGTSVGGFGLICVCVCHSGFGFGFAVFDWRLLGGVC